jgi:MoaA/NifB/PqqE/SkfB family radical SAM enzyme
MRRLIVKIVDALARMASKSNAGQWLLGHIHLSAENYLRVEIDVTHLSRREYEAELQMFYGESIHARLSNPVFVINDGTRKELRFHSKSEDGREFVMVDNDGELHSCSTWKECERCGQWN